MSERSIRHAIGIFKEVQRVATPKRGIYEIRGSTEETDERQRVATLELEMLENALPEEIAVKEVLMVSPTPPSFTQEKLQLLPAREGQQSLFEIPDWATVINEIAEFSGGNPLTEKHIASIKERAGTLDLKVMAMEFESHHRIKQSKKKYPTFSTFGRVGTWLKNALRDDNDGKTGKSGKHLVSNREGRDGAFADPSRYHD